VLCQEVSDHTFLTDLWISSLQQTCCPFLLAEY
jgi:hypothetical protein